MPVTIDPLKKAKVKKALKEGKSARQALKDANYKDIYAHRSTLTPVVKICKEELKQEFKASDVTVDSVVKELAKDRELARKKKDYATSTRCTELLGKYIAMFTDKRDITNKNPDKLVIVYDKQKPQHIVSGDTKEIETDKTISVKP